MLANIEFFNLNLCLCDGVALTFIPSHHSTSINLCLQIIKQNDFKLILMQ